MSEILKNDVDPIETQDWLQSLDSLIREEGVERAHISSSKLSDRLVLMVLLYQQVLQPIM